MAPRKIIFFIIVGLISLIALVSIYILSNSKKNEKAQSVGNLSIWLVGGETQDYLKVFEPARALIPELKDTNFDIRVFPNYASYRDVLLSTLASGGGPDIFAIEAGGDDILASRSISIPEEFIDISDFEKRYEDIFLDLLETNGEGASLSRSLKGVPLGYETLGVFYHKSLFPYLPKTWNEIQAFYKDGAINGVYPVNIGMGPGYTPFATDIIALFLLNNKIQGTKDIKSGNNAILDYISYATSELSSEKNDESIVSAPKMLLGERERMDSEGLTTLDLFIRGEIGMVIGFPSIVRELEKAEKRSEGKSFDSLILTERIPQETLSKSALNLARYSYLALSANSKNPVVSAKFLGYLMSEEALLQAKDAFPYWISPDRTIMSTQGSTSLSRIFGRARLDSFLPEPGEKLFVYQYGLKNEYEKIFQDNIDRGERIDINTIVSRLQSAVECKIESSSGDTLSEKCLVD